MTSTPALRASLLASLLACAWPTHVQAAGDFVTLSATQCEAAATGTPLPADMEPYRAAVKVCALSRPAQPPQIRLISVFTDDYYKSLPANAPWENFPLPVLVDASGRCVGRLAHLFPVDPPQELVVSAGHWRRGVPHELRLKVLSPAVGGNYPLPSLRWNAKTQAYQTTPSPHQSTPTPSEDKTPCP
ncbi:MAG: hypothetical protein KKG67_03930 [Gammaproteobacteria bacterium]|nr:hypothetical protein [Gammaproteobacteria bacterium]